MHKKAKAKVKKPNLRKILAEYGFHIWIILLLSNFIILYATHLFISASTCMTPEEVKKDNRCLYIAENQIYERGTKSTPFKGYPCGSDITSSLQPNDLKSQLDLEPYFVANVCEVSAQNTNPTPDSASPNQSDVSTGSVANPSGTQSSVDISVPSEESTESAKDILPPKDPTSTPEPKGAILQLALTMPGIGSNGGNMNPIHPTRDVVIYFYKTTENALDPRVKPLYSIKSNVYFDRNPYNPTYTSFINNYIDLGTAIPSGRYQIVDQIWEKKADQV